MRLELSLRTHTGGHTEWYPVHSGELPEGLLAEGQNYIVRLREIPSDIDIHSLKLLLGGVTSERHYLEDSANSRRVQWRWSPEFYSGLFRGAVVLGNEERYPPLLSFSLEVDPARAKLHRDDFRIMLSDISQWSQSLWAVSGARAGVGRGEGYQPPPLAYLEYAEQHLDEVARVVRRIARNPRSCFEAVYRDERLERCRYVDATSLRQVAGQMARQAQGQLPEAVRGAKLEFIPPELWPPRILERQTRLTYDVRENRFVRTFLLQLQRALLGLQNRLRDAKAGTDEELAQRVRRNRHLTRKLLFQTWQLLDLPFLQEVGTDAQALNPTTTLLRDLRYSRLYELFRRFPRTSVALGSDFELTMERTYELYEKWCFLKVVAVLSELYGEPTRLSPSFFGKTDGPVFQLPDDAKAEFGPGVRVTWQRTFSSLGSSWDTPSLSGLRSYGVEVRPDIVIELDGSGAGSSGAAGSGLDTGESRLVILDPKYRVSPSRVREGLGDMHRYRDAIISGLSADGFIDPEPVAGAFVLCPDDAPEVCRFFKQGYRKRFGFGGIVMKPGEPAGALKAFLARLGGGER